MPFDGHLVSMVSTAVGIGTEKVVDVGWLVLLGCVVLDADEAVELWIAAKGASEFDLLTL